MTTLILCYDSGGVAGRCDANCYDAKHPHCKCICGGKNHGVGLDRALEQTEELAEEWIDEYGAQHPEVIAWQIPGRRPVQLSLWEELFNYD